MVIKVCEDKRQIFGGKGKLARLTIVLFLLSSQTLCRSSFAQDINWDKLIPIIAQIESSNNPFAYNSTSHAKGPYQITPICLKEYNARHTASKIASNALYSPIEARKVAEWYLVLSEYPKCSNFMAFLAILNISYGLLMQA